MVCQRCNKSFDSTVPELNVQMYRDSAVYACPHCGQAYHFRAITRIVAEPFETENDSDDWGRKIKHHKKSI